ncbi:phage protease [Methylobacterium radiotolerans]|uniref:phage protease n=1 Tax=Methylobacterium radiotolerans TaxID=31998 RepID=UPI001F20BE91|nr:phage protease [Methylobacterium radiotolerans]UIY44134.1 phage protease [Methylobacterium radiotolerans]
MTQRPATTDLIAIGVVAGEVALAAAGAGPEWIKVTPRGPVKTRDGRTYSFNPEALAARFDADKVEVPVDVDHGLALRATKGERVDAVGYAAALQARDDGTYARINWLDGGLSVLQAKTHRYVSPSFPHDAAGNAAWLHSISLVAAPALSMPALLHALGYSESPMKQIAKALGLAEDADETACLAALGKVLNPVAKALGLAETSDMQACLSAIGTIKAGGSDLVATLQSQLASTTSLVGELQKSARDRDVNELLEGALKEKKIAPAQREHLASLCATDEGLKGVRAMLAATAPGLQASGLDGLQPDDGSAGHDPVTLAAKARSIQDEREKVGAPISMSEAVAIASKQKA